MLLAAATLGNSCPLGCPDSPRDAAKFGLAHVAGIAVRFVRARDVSCRPEEALSSSSFAVLLVPPPSFANGSRNISVKDISCRGFQRSSLADRYFGDHASD